MAKLYTLKPLIKASNNLQSPSRETHKQNIELEEISSIIANLPELQKHLKQIDLDVYGENKKVKVQGRNNKLSAERILKLGVLKTIREYSYRQLEFALCDSASAMNFIDLGVTEEIKKATINGALKRVKDSTWQAINTSILDYAKKKDFENGKASRIDCTVTKTNIHYPTDYNLINDFIRVICRNVLKIKNILYKISENKIESNFQDCTRSSKSNLFKINNLRQQTKIRRIQLKQIRTGDFVVEQTRQFLAELEGKDFKFASVADEVQYDVCKAEIKRVYELACKISNVARRRVVEKEKVPASEKIFSIFEVHTDIITKGKRDSEFGHKILLAGGKSGLIHSVETLSGNPTDSKLFTKAMDNHVKIYGVAPEKVATDGCFGSKENQEYAKKIGVKELTFCKRRSLDILSSEKIKENFTKLKNFRAGIEGDISYCKRKLVMGKILAKGLGSFKSSIQVSVITKNLITIARIQITKRLKKVSRTLKKAA